MRKRKIDQFATSGADASERNAENCSEKTLSKEVFQKKSNRFPFEKEKTFKVAFTFHFIMHLDEVVFTKTIDEVHRILSKMELCFDIPVKTEEKSSIKIKENWYLLEF